MNPAHSTSISAGLGFAVAVPPNLRHLNCYFEAEARAQAVSYLQARNITWADRNGDVYVPAEQRIGVLAERRIVAFGHQLLDADDAVPAEQAKATVVEQAVVGEAEHRLAVDQHARRGTEKLQRDLVVHAGIDRVRRGTAFHQVGDLLRRAGDFEDEALDRTIDQPRPHDVGDADLARQVERAATLCKTDLVSQVVVRMYLGALAAE